MEIENIQMVIIEKYSNWHKSFIEKFNSRVCMVVEEINKFYIQSIEIIQFEGQRKK